MCEKVRAIFVREVPILVHGLIFIETVRGPLVARPIKKHFLCLFHSFFCIKIHISCLFLHGEFLPLGLLNTPFLEKLMPGVFNMNNVVFIT